MTMVGALPRPNIIAAAVMYQRRDSYSVSQHAQIIPGVCAHNEEPYQTITRSPIRPRLFASPPYAPRNMETPMPENRSTRLSARWCKVRATQKTQKTPAPRIWPDPYEVHTTDIQDAW